MHDYERSLYFAWIKIDYKETYLVFLAFKFQKGLRSRIASIVEDFYRHGSRSPMSELARKWCIASEGPLSKQALWSLSKQAKETNLWKYWERWRHATPGGVTSFHTFHDRKLLTFAKHFIGVYYLGVRANGTQVSPSILGRLEKMAMIPDHVRLCVRVEGKSSITN